MRWPSPGRVPVEADAEAGVDMECVAELGVYADDKDVCADADE